MIRTIFMGSPEFAVPSLLSLSHRHDIDVTLVVTQPDRRAGRGRILRPPEVKVAAQELGIPVFQPESLRLPEAGLRLQREQPDVIVVVSFGEILRKEILEAAPLGCLNVHPSLLPRYRGSTPIPAAILNGDHETGVSIIQLVRRMDAGPVLDQVRMPLDGSETAGTLAGQLSNLAAERLPGVVSDWVAGRLEPAPQNDSSATYTRELRKADGQIDWRWSAAYIERFVRAMDPWPGAWTTYAGQRLAVQQVVPSVEIQTNTSDIPGAVLVRSRLVEVTTGEGTLELRQVQPSGKKTMQALDWVRGLREQVPGAFDYPLDDREPIIYTR